MTFDRLAPHYDWMETILAGGRLQRTRTFWLDRLRGRRRILSLGEGHGRFAEACVERFPNAELTCIEASRPMLARAQQRLGRKAGRVRWKHAEVPTEELDGPFDAIVTCFFLDCFPPSTLDAVIGQAARSSTPDALWLLADFALPERGLAHWRARAVHFLMYAFFRRVAGLPARHLTPADDRLSAHGFTLAGRQEFDWGLLRADVWQRTAAVPPSSRDHSLGPGHADAT